MRVDQIMTREVHAVAFDVDADAASQHMRRAGVRHLVVLGEDDEIAGVLSDRDLAKHTPAALARQTVRELMTAHAMVASVDMDVRDAAKLMRDHVIGCLPVVVDQHVVGIVTITDMLALIVGDRELDPTAIAKPVEILRGRILRR